MDGLTGWMGEPTVTGVLTGAGLLIAGFALVLGRRWFAEDALSDARFYRGFGALMVAVLGVPLLASGNWYGGGCGVLGGIALLSRAGQIAARHSGEQPSDPWLIAAGGAVILTVGLVLVTGALPTTT